MPRGNVAEYLYDRDNNDKGAGWQIKRANEPYILYEVSSFDIRDHK